MKTFDHSQLAEPIPSMKLDLTLLGIHSVTAFYNTVMLLVPGSFGLNVFGILWGGAFAVWQWKISLPKKRRERAEWRKARWEYWVYTRELPKEADPEPWEEIERAMGVLMEREVEPTYERAKDFLRREKMPVCEAPGCETKINAGTKCGICLAAERRERDAMNPFKRPEPTIIPPLTPMAYKVKEAIEMGWITRAEGLDILDNMEMYRSSWG